MANATIGNEMQRGSIVFEPEEGGGTLDMMQKDE
jgi:hypothetical protein